MELTGARRVCDVGSGELFKVVRGQEFGSSTVNDEVLTKVLAILISYLHLADLRFST